MHTMQLKQQAAGKMQAKMACLLSTSLTHNSQFESIPPQLKHCKERKKKRKQVKRSC
jgi:hypothetical protein